MSGVSQSRSTQPPPTPCWACECPGKAQPCALSCLTEANPAPFPHQIKGGQRFTPLAGRRGQGSSLLFHTAPFGAGGPLPRGTLRTVPFSRVSLAPTHQMPAAPHSPAVTTGKVCRHCHTSPGAQSHPGWRTRLCDIGAGWKGGQDCGCIAVQPVPGTFHLATPELRLAKRRLPFSPAAPSAAPTLRSAAVNQKGSVCLSVAGLFH